MLKKLQLIIFLFIILVIFSACAKTDPVTGEKVLIETDPNKKAREAADKGGGFIGNISRDGNRSSPIVDFANSNVLWRATLKTLEFLPLSNTDYTGGVISYDWYSENGNEEIKVTVRFLSNELKSDSIQIISHKRTCTNLNSCTVKKTDEYLANEIRDTIIASARKMKIEEAKKEKK